VDWRGGVVEIVLEHEEVDRLLREALQARGVRVPPDAEFRVRNNHKKGTMRVVYQSEEKKP
jgi:hypothetical protein